MSEFVRINISEEMPSAYQGVGGHGQFGSACYGNERRIVADSQYRIRRGALEVAADNIEF